MTTDTLTVPWADRVLCNDPPGHPNWLKAHKGYYGAHDIASILGMGYETPLTVWAHATGKLEREDISELPWIEDGTDFEPVIIARFARKTSRQILPSPGLVRHPTCPYIAVTPDRAQIHPETGMLGPVEVKSVGFHRKRDWEEGIPMQHQLQVQVQMDCMDVDWGSVAGLPIGRARGEPGLIYADVVREPVYLAWMLEEVVNFHETYVLKDNPPPALQDDTSVLKRMFRKERTGTVIELDNEDLALWQEKEAIQADNNAGEKRIEAIKAHLMQKMGETHFGALPDGRYLRFQLQKYGAREAGESRVMRVVKGVQ